MDDENHLKKKATSANNLFISLGLTFHSSTILLTELVIDLFN